MLVPCQITLWYLLPAISAELVREFKKLGVKQSEMAHMLGVTPAAVSQYVKGKRGATIKFSPDIKKQIHLLAGRIASGEITDEGLSKSICNICIYIRKTKTMCSLHKAISGKDQICEMCYRDFNEKRDIHG